MNRVGPRGGGANIIDARAIAATPNAFNLASFLVAGEFVVAHLVMRREQMPAGIGAGLLAVRRFGDARWVPCGVGFEARHL